LQSTTATHTDTLFSSYYDNAVETNTFTSYSFCAFDNKEESIEKEKRGEVVISVGLLSSHPTRGSIVPLKH
jgi:hypothetical protein